jgi:hypothetical protein
VLVRMGELDEAERLLAEIGDSLPAGPAFTARTVHAELMLARGSIADATRIIEAELIRLRHPSARASPSLSEALRVASRVHLAAGDPGRARTLAREAVATAERLARDPAQSAHVGEALLLQAQAEARLGESARSAASARRAAESLARGLADDHPLTREAIALATR